MNHSISLTKCIFSNGRISLRHRGLGDEESRLKILVLQYLAYFCKMQINAIFSSLQSIVYHGGACHINTVVCTECFTSANCRFTDAQGIYSYSIRELLLDMDERTHTS